MPATMLSDTLPQQHGDRRLTLEEQVRDLLSGAGLQEVITYSLTMPERESPLGQASGEYVRLKNPVSAERVVMRHTLLAGVLEVAANNLRNTADVRLFEVGPVYLPKAGEKLPEEPLRLALVVTGRRQPEFWADSGTAPPALDFFDLKGIVEALIAGLHLPNVSYRRSAAPYLHPGRSAELLVDGKPVGSFGQLHPRVAIAFNQADKLFKQLLERQLFVAEFDLETMLAAVPERYPFKTVSLFEHALRDIAVVVPDEVTAEQVTTTIVAAGGNLLRHVRLFDVYRGDNIPAGTKSLAYALTYQAEDRTLADREITEAHRNIEAQLRQTFKAQIRGEETR
jgi:phenylalanyl-tRNA synthetase beta chain